MKSALEMIRTAAEFIERHGLEPDAMSVSVFRWDEGGPRLQLASLAVFNRLFAGQKVTFDRGYNVYSGTIEGMKVICSVAAPPWEVEVEVEVPVAETRA